MHILMLSCRKATELIDKQLHFTLTPLEKTRLFMHTLFCDACTQYKKQSRFLHKLFFKDHTHPEKLPVSDTTGLKKKILNNLEEK